MNKVRGGGKAMSVDPQDNRESLIAAYQQLCTSYQAIADFRAKLLGFLPLATGGGIFLLLNTLTDETKQFMLPIGAFGFAITLGLFSYEIHGIGTGDALIRRGKLIEDELGIHGQFQAQPREVVSLIPFAASVIYPAVLAAWAFLALVFAWPQAAPWGAVVVFIVGFVWTTIRNLRLRRSL